jgi:hypothetical protein
MQANSRVARQATSIPSAQKKDDLQRYFEPGDRAVDGAGLKEITFGEFLVEEGVLDRFQLFRALQMQDRSPGTRLGECAAALGYAPKGAIERLYQRFQQLSTVDVG